MKKILLLIFTVILLSTSCEKIEDCPACIKNKVKEFARKHVCNNGTAKVGEYSFQGRYVYVFSAGNCGADLSSAVYTSDCVNLGYLGGITGNITINGVLFSQFAIFKREIWHD